MLKNPEFRTLCTDYGKCIEAGKFWGQSNVTGAKAKVEEYRYLSKALEQELLLELKQDVETPD